MSFREYSTVCPRDCCDGCFLKVRLDETQRIISVKGDENSPITRGLTCPRAAGDSKRVYNNRVLYPHLREDEKPGKLVKRITWDKALALVSEKLKDTITTHGPESVLLLDYAGNTSVLASSFPRRLWNALGVTRTDYSLCNKAGHVALKLHYGLSYGLMPEDILQKKLIVYWGFNAVSSASHIWKLSLEAKSSNGAQIVTIDPRRSKTVEKSDLWIRPRPGTDTILVFGIMRYLIENNYVDMKFIEEWTLGYSQLKEEVMKWTLETVEAITGVKKELIEELGHIYGEIKPSATQIGSGMQQSIQGAESVRAIALLTSLLGYHRGFFYSNGTAFTVDFDYLESASQQVKDARVVSQVELGDHIKNGEFKFVYIYNMNPALTVPGQAGFREGIQRDDVFCVVHDTHWTETTDFADVVLPAQTYLEKDDLALAWAHNHIQLVKKVIDPLEESKHEIWVMQQIAKRLNREEEWLFEDPWDAAKKAFEGALESGTFDDLVNGEQLKLKYKALSAYQTPSGRIELYSSKALEMDLEPLPVHKNLDRTSDEFILLNSSIPNYLHTQFQEVYGPIPAVVHINPADAKELGINNEDQIVLQNELGHMTVKAIVTDSVPKRVLWSPKECIGLKGEPQNSLTSTSPQEIGGGSTYNSTLVRIMKE